MGVMLASPLGCSECCDDCADIESESTNGCIDVVLTPSGEDRTVVLSCCAEDLPNILDVSVIGSEENGCECPNGDGEPFQLVWNGFDAWTGSESLCIGGPELILTLKCEGSTFCLNIGCAANSIQRKADIGGSCDPFRQSFSNLCLGDSEGECCGEFTGENLGCGCLNHESPPSTPRDSKGSPIFWFVTAVASADADHRISTECCEETLLPDKIDFVVNSNCVCLDGLSGTAVTNIVGAPFWTGTAIDLDLNCRRVTVRIRCCVNADGVPLFHLTLSDGLFPNQNTCNLMCDTEYTCEPFSFETPVGGNSESLVDGCCTFCCPNTPLVEQVTLTIVGTSRCACFSGSYVVPRRPNNANVWQVTIDNPCSTSMPPQQMMLTVSCAGAGGVSVIRCAIAAFSSGRAASDPDFSCQPISASTPTVTASSNLCIGTSDPPFTLQFSVS